MAGKIVNILPQWVICADAVQTGDGVDQIQVAYQRATGDQTESPSPITPVVRRRKPNRDIAKIVGLADRITVQGRTVFAWSNSAVPATR